MSLFEKLNRTSTNLTEGPITKGIVNFCIPIFLGQLLQQLYNLADAWVIGNFAENEAFAAVSSMGSISFFIIGFFGGIAIGGGVVISKYFGAADEKKVEESIHTNFLFGIISSVVATVFGLLFVPVLLRIMKTPAEVLPYSLAYTRVIFGGVSATIMYNICMAIMRAIGDSVRPLIYLMVSSVTNVILDLTFVVGFHWGVVGAAAATVAAQTISVILCVTKMMQATDYTRLVPGKLKWHGKLMKEVIIQGIPNGIQNSVISIGNMTVQANINLFGSYAMSGMGAYSKIEGFVFLPINCISMALPTYISQNLGAKKYDRAKKGAVVGIGAGVLMSEIVGILLFFLSKYILKLFIDDAESLNYGIIHAQTVSLFFFLLAFSHCAAGVMRGCGKSIIPMVTMLSFWCVFRVTYVTIAVKLFPYFRTISCAYPITWTLSSTVFLIYLLKADWTHAFERQKI